MKKQQHDIQTWGDRLNTLHNAGQPFPSLSAEHPTADLEQAYAVQRVYVADLPEQIAGYKAALTAEPAQRMMSIDVAIIGVLFESGATQPGAALNPQGPVILETEIGFRTNRSIEAQ